MEYLWSSYGATRQQHARSRLSVPGRDGEDIRRVKGVEKLGQAGGGGGIRWVARGRQEGGSEGKGSGHRVRLGAGRHSRLKLLGLIERR
jgi:hypothetical protein